MNTTYIPELGKPSRLVIILLAILTVIGGAAVIYRIYTGIGTTALSNVVPWGLWVSLYIFFIGLSAGSFLLSTLIFVFHMKELEAVGRLALLQAFICLLTGIIFISMDIGKIFRFWHPLVYPQFKSSVLAYEIWLYGGYILMILAELWLLMRLDLARLAKGTLNGMAGIYHKLSLGHKIPQDSQEASALAKDTMKKLTILGMIGIPLAIGVHGGTGGIFAVVKARPFWHTAIFPLVFIVSALASGGGLLMFLKAFLHPDKESSDTVLPLLAKLTGGFLIFDLFLLGLELLVGFYGDIPEHLEVYHLMLAGPHWYVFWILQMLIGAVIPLYLIFFKDKKNAATYGIAGILIVLGIIGVRLNIVIPALAVPILPGYDQALDSARYTANYFPNWVEILSSIGVISLMCLAGYIMSMYLPMIEKEEHVSESKEVR